MEFIGAVEIDDRMPGLDMVIFDLGRPRQRPRYKLPPSVRRLDQLGDVGLVICDEAHHAVAATWRTMLNAVAKLLGVTATPSRLDGKGLGVHAGGIFDDLIIGATVAELTEAGWLAPARVFTAGSWLNLRGISTVAGDYAKGQLGAAVMQADLAGDAVGDRTRGGHCDRVPQCGISCGLRELPTHERDRLIAGLGNGEVEVLASCEILGEDVDIPSIGATILLRSTKSLTLYLQQIGRGLRPAPGKSPS